MLGIGVDIQSVERTWKVFGGSESSMMRIFTDDEKKYCFSKSDPYIHLAGRFAAKEAVVKALTPSKEDGNLVGDVEIVHLENGGVECLLGGSAFKRFRELGARKVHLSISHTENMAAAFAIIE